MLRFVEPDYDEERIYIDYFLSLHPTGKTIRSSITYLEQQL
jgi:hypothetical protein